MKIEVRNNAIVIDGRYIMYQDGVVYDELGKDIPQWIFEFRDFILENFDTMLHQVEVREMPV